VGYLRGPRAGRLRLAVALGAGALLIVASLHPLPVIHERWRQLPADIDPAGD